MQVLGIAGWSGSGKTTLLAGLIPCLIRHGLSVSTIKHAHHRFELDVAGKDSFRHRKAGAREVILANDGQFALFHESEAAPGPGLPALLGRLSPVDLVLVEGFGRENFARLEVHRPSLGRPPLWLRTPALAVAADAPLRDCPHPVLPLDRPEIIAAFIIGQFFPGQSAAGQTPAPEA